MQDEIVIEVHVNERSGKLIDVRSNGGSVIIKQHSYVDYSVEYMSNRNNNE